MGPRGEAFLNKFEQASKLKHPNKPQVELELYYYLGLNVTKKSLPVILGGYKAFKEANSRTAHVPFDHVLLQLENASLKSSNNIVTTTIHLQGAEISALWGLLAMMLDQDFVTDEVAEELELILINFFESVVPA